MSFIIHRCVILKENNTFLLLPASVPFETWKLYSNLLKKIL